MGRQVYGHRTYFREDKAVAGLRIGGIRPGGLVDIVASRNTDPALFELPTKVHVVYVPVGSGPPDPALGPENLLAGGYPVGTADFPPGGGNFTVLVRGVKPGEYDVQLIVEFPDDATTVTIGGQVIG